MCVGSDWRSVEEKRGTRRMHEGGEMGGKEKKKEEGKAGRKREEGHCVKEAEKKPPLWQYRGCSLLAGGFVGRMDGWI